MLSSYGKKGPHVASFTSSSNELLHLVGSPPTKILVGVWAVQNIMGAKSDTQKNTKENKENTI